MSRRRRLARTLWLFNTLSTLSVLQPAQAQTLPPVLPPHDRVAQVLDDHPRVQAARAQGQAAEGRRQRLEAGPHEWTVKLGTQSRRDLGGARSVDSEVAIERGWRGADKRRADGRLAEAERSVAELQAADARHEAARELLALWFAGLREGLNQSILQQHLALAERQVAIATRRVQAGDAAALERQSAQADLLRWQAQLMQATTRWQEQAQRLAHQFPGLTLPAQAPTFDAQAWSQRADAPLDTADLVSRILEDNHELGLAQRLAELQQRTAARAHAETRADATVGVRYARERSGAESVVGVYVSLPLGGVARQGDARVAEALAAMAMQDWHALQRKVSAEAQVLAQGTQRAALQRAQRLQVAIQMNQAATLAARAYELGEGAMADVLQARRLALEAQLEAGAAVLDEMQLHARALLDSHRLWATHEGGDATASITPSKEATP